MAQHLIYHWKHGWIPLTHAAAMSKAHGNAKLADKYVPGASAHHGDRATAGKSAREIHAGLEAHTLKPGDHATVSGIDQYGQSTTFTGHVAAVSAVRIKEGRNGTPVPHVAVQMHAGPAEDKGMGHARGVVYVPNPSPDADVSDAHRYTPERGAAAAAALQTAHDQAQAAQTARLNAGRVARTRPTPSATDISEAKDRWQRDNPGKKIAGHEREIDRIANDIWERKELAGKGHGPTAEQAAAERARKLRATDHSAQMRALGLDNPAVVNLADVPNPAAAREARRAAWLKRSEAESAAAAERLGMTFPKPTVRAHGLVGDGATVEAPTSEARRFGQAANSGQRANVQQAQAAERAATAKRVKPVQGEMFGASGEHQPDMFDQAQQPASPAHSASTARVQIAHSGDGTLASIGRSDVEARTALKDAGFRWSSNLGQWYMPRSWSEPTRRQKLAQVQSKLGGEHVNIKDSGPAATVSAADREAETRARAAGRAERKDAQAARLAGEADARFGKAKQIGDMIPLGQPILVGHHSEGRHRSDIAKIDSNMRKGVEAHQASQDAAHAADNARRTAAGDSPLARQRRIDRNEAEARKIDRQLAEHNAATKMTAAPSFESKSEAVKAHVERLKISADYHAQLTARRAELADQITHDQRQIAASGHQAVTADQIQTGDIVHYRGRPHVVKKVNQKTVSVPTGYSWDDKIPLNQVTKHTPLSTQSTQAIETVLANTKDAKIRARFIAELRSRGVIITGG